jgi:hypothetical protein
MGTMGIKILGLVNAAYHNIWFNSVYLFASFIANLAVTGVGWGMAVLYIVGAATLDFNKDKLS